MTTFNLSDSDRNAIAFYEENLNFVNGFGLTNLEQDERRMFKKGRTLVEKVAAAAHAALNPRKGNVKWTAEEYDAIAEAYHQHEGNRPAIVEMFMTFSDRHTPSAVDIAAQSCKALDTNYPQTGMTDHADGLLNALNAITPNRFSSNR